MSERRKAEYLATIQQSLVTPQEPKQGQTVVNRVFELGKILTTTTTSNVPDSIERVNRRERALHLAVGIVAGPVEDLPRAEMVLNAIKPEVAGVIREKLVVTAADLKGSKLLK